MPNYTARQIGAATAAGGVGGAAVRLATDLNPEPVTRMVTKSIMDPEGSGGSVAHKVMETFTPDSPVVQDLLRNAVDTGWKTALATGGAVAAYKGIKKIHSAVSKRQQDGANKG